MNARELRMTACLLFALLYLALFGGAGAESRVPLQEMALGTAALALISVPVRIVLARVRERRS